MSTRTTGRSLSETSVGRALSNKALPSKAMANEASANKTFLKNELAIHKTLNNYISERSFGANVRDICRDSGISRPTFYAHSANINAAYANYEQSLVRQFISSLPGRPIRKIIFTLLLSFTYHERAYFRATSRNTDFCTLGRILDRVRLLLVGTQISDQAFIIYRNEIASLIMIWANFDHFRKARIDFYLDKIMRVKPREW